MIANTRLTGKTAGRVMGSLLYKGRSEADRIYPLRCMSGPITGLSGVSVTGLDYKYPFDLSRAVEDDEFAVDARSVMCYNGNVGKSTKCES